MDTRYRIGLGKGTISIKIAQQFEDEVIKPNSGDLTERSSTAKPGIYDKNGTFFDKVRRGQVKLDPKWNPVFNAIYQGAGDGYWIGPKAARAFAERAGEAMGMGNGPNAAKQKAFQDYAIDRNKQAEGKATAESAAAEARAKTFRSGAYLKSDAAFCGMPLDWQKENKETYEKQHGPVPKCLPLAPGGQ